MSCNATHEFHLKWKEASSERRSACLAAGNGERDKVLFVAQFIRSEWQMYERKAQRVQWRMSGARGETLYTRIIRAIIAVLHVLDIVYRKM